MGILGILVIWSIGTLTALFAFRGVSSARSFALEVRAERRRMEERMEALEQGAEVLRRDGEIQVRALGNIAIEARMILERARATTQFSTSLEGEQLRRMLESKQGTASPERAHLVPKPDEFVNAAIEDKIPSIRMLFT